MRACGRYLHAADRATYEEASLRGSRHRHASCTATPRDRDTACWSARAAAPRPAEPTDTAMRLAVAALWRVLHSISTIMRM